MNELPLNQVLCGDCREVMADFPGDSVDLVVTSPPYWGLRDYGSDHQIWNGDPNCEHSWDGGSHKWKYSGGISPDFTGQFSDDRTHFETETNYCSKCGAWKGSLGLEPHPQMFVDHIVEVSRELKRVIKPRGSYWLNLGDTYYGSGKGAGTKNAKERYIPEVNPIKQNLRSEWLQPKQLLGIPWRVATALQHDGWILRNCVIWYKPNHMPESVKDRLTKSYEFMFFFVKSSKNTVWKNDLTGKWRFKEPKQEYYLDENDEECPVWRGYDYYFNLDRIRIPHSYPETFGPRPDLGKTGDTQYSMAPGKRMGNIKGKNPGDMWEIPTYPFPGAHFAVFPPTLIEPIVKAGCPKNGVVLDPFAGSGTALRVARKLGRRFIGIDINPEYVEMCEQRVRADGYSPPPEGVPTLTEILDREKQTKRMVEK